MYMPSKSSWLGHLLQFGGFFSISQPWGHLRLELLSSISLLGGLGAKVVAWLGSLQMSCFASCLGGAGHGLSIGVVLLWLGLLVVISAWAALGVLELSCEWS
jgi:hypothetical protein